MKIEKLKLKGTYEITLAPIYDKRGYFMRAYDKKIFEEHNLINEWVQENQSLSTNNGIIRGLHFQKPPYSETKFIRVIQGSILDVFVDLRRSSPTYGKWDSIKLSSENQKAVYIPKGFAHGFCTLESPALVFYKVDSLYTPESEDGLRWNDEKLNISWPAENPIVSEKDSRWIDFNDFKSPFD